MENETAKSDIISLSDAEVGKRYQVVNVKAKGAVHQRMLDMGLVPGVRLWVVRFAPLGDPIEIRVRHFLMSLRKDEAKDVEVVDLGYHHSHHHKHRPCEDCPRGRGQGREQGLGRGQGQGRDRDHTSKFEGRPRGKGFFRHHRWKKEDDE